VADWQGFVRQLFFDLYIQWFQILSFMLREWDKSGIEKSLDS
jgi:hypothetical protein